MRNRFTLTVLGALLLTMACSQNTTVEAPELVADKATNVATNTPLKASRPNILLIVGDDVGYSDLGAYGGEIETPNLDSLAKNGRLLTNFYVAGTCSPTRAMLMSGADHHLVGLGAMGEHMAPNQIGQPGYETHLNDRAVTIASRLKAADYRTYMAGKWHLGVTEELSPAARGFDKSIALLVGGASHLDKRGLNGNVDPAKYREDGKLIPLPEEFKYSTDYYTDKMISYVDSSKDSGKPFFGYLAYTAPHWPLHARPEDMAKYEGRYDTGWKALQTERFKRMKSMGMVPETAVLPEIVTDFPEWEALSDKERAYEAKRMEIYAAMVDRLDQKVGDMITYLKDSGQYDNTLIIFMSDNGAEGAAMQDMEIFIDYVKGFDNSYESMGSKESYIFLEERWAQATGAPLRFWKGIVSDGGIKVPAIVSYGGVVNQGTRYDGVVSVMDLAPTFLELAGANETTGLEGKTNIVPLQGKSMLPLLGSGEPVRSETDGLGWELFTRKGYRLGKWKATHLTADMTDGEWALYDVNIDPGETTDLKSQYPDVMAQMIAGWETYAANNNVIVGNTPPDR